MTPKNLDWTILDSQYISHHIYFTARRDRCQRPDGQIVPEYFVVELPPSVCILPLTENNEVVMIRQYRHPLRQTILEIPGGFVDPLEDLAEAAKRELLEETGYAFDQVLPLGKTAANPGLLDNFTSLYLATGGRKVQAQHLDTNEEIEIVLMPLDVLTGMLRRHELVQSMHTCCLFYALLHMGRLKFV
jgi:8-oxo-dGTP pyrophosphatase MutT (NUDIX family)